MAAVDSDMTALNGHNAQADQIARAAKVYLAPISRVHTLWQEIGTWTYIRCSLYGASYLLVVATGTGFVDHIDVNFSTLERQINSPTRCTSFAYDISWGMSTGSVTDTTPHKIVSG